MWAAATVIVIAFGGPYRPIAFQGFGGNQHIRDPTWSENPFLTRLRNGSRSCFVGFGCFATLHIPFVLHSFACMFLHVPFVCMHIIPFILHSFPVMFLSFSFHVPFMSLSLAFNYNPFIFLSYSFQCACMPFHPPFMFLSICMHVPFILPHVLSFAF